MFDIGRPLALQARRRPPWYDLVLVGDGGFSAPLFLGAMCCVRITATSLTHRWINLDTGGP